MPIDLAHDENETVLKKMHLSILRLHKKMDAFFSLSWLFNKMFNLLKNGSFIMENKVTNLPTLQDIKDSYEYQHPSTLDTFTEIENLVIDSEGRIRSRDEKNINKSLYVRDDSTGSMKPVTITESHDIKKIQTDYSRLEDKFDKMSNMLSGLMIQMTQQTQLILEQNQRLDEQNKKLEEQQKEIQELRKENQALKAMVTTQSHEISRLNHTVAEQKQEIEAQNKKLARQDQQTSRLGQQLAELQQRNDQLEQQNQGFQIGMRTRKIDHLLDIKERIKNNPDWQDRCDGVKYTLSFFETANVNLKDSQATSRDALEHLDDSQLNGLAANIKDTLSNRLHTHARRNQVVHNFYIDSIAKIGPNV
jgi:chromosome segregation ATPase